MIRFRLRCSSQKNGVIPRRTDPSGISQTGSLKTNPTTAPIAANPATIAMNRLNGRLTSACS